MDSYVGEIKLFAFARTPTDWLPCEGQLLDVNTYSTLFSLISSTYGGDGVNNFALPDLRGRVPVSYGQGNGLTPRNPGETLGSNTVTLTTAQIPAHSHAFIAASGAATSTTPGPTLVPATTDANVRQFIDTTQPTGATATYHPQTVGSDGGNTPHNNMMPTTAMQFAICTQGLYPST
jgi:microcystin-dependent protein